MRLTSIGVLTWAFVAAAGVRGQTGPGKLEFEAASVKLSDPAGRGMTMTGGPGTNDPERVTIQRYHLESLILEAYDVQTYEVTGPGWLVGNFGPDSVKVDVSAKLPPGTTKEQYRLMLQNLLVERFGLTLHHVKKDWPAYDLVVMKNGPKFTPSSGEPSPGGGATMSAGPGGAKMHYPNETMERFAQFLSRQAGNPVRDATGLRGEFDVSLSWGGADNVTLEEAVQDQLGLKLNSVKGQIDVLVIDHMEKVPTAN